MVPSSVLIAIGIAAGIAIGIGGIGYNAFASPSMGMQQNQQTNMTAMMMGSMQQPFNPDAPITIPLIDGYYNGNKVFFVHTEVSDKMMAGQTE